MCVVLLPLLPYEIVLNIFQSLQKTDMQDASLVSYTRR